MAIVFQVMAAAPWGDYGVTLAHGIAGPPRPSDGRIPLERTAPFLPPVTVPARTVIVTESMRIAIEKARLTGAMFVPVNKTRIVRYSWEEWDLRAPAPREIPKSGQAEDYVKSRPHDPALAAEMPPLFQILPGGTARVSIVEIPIGTGKKMVKDPSTGQLKDVPNVERRKQIDSYDGSDFGAGSPVGKPVYVSERAREMIASEWLRFEAYETPR